MTNSGQGNNPVGGGNKFATPKKASYGLELTSTVTENEIILRIRTSKNGSPAALETIIHRDRKEVSRNTSADDGFLEYKTSYSLSDKKQTTEFEVFLKESTEKASATIDLPEKSVSKTDKSDSDDPQKVILVRLHDGEGNFRVFVRVLKAKGYGLSTTVDLLTRTEKYTVKTNSRGVAVWNFPGIVAPGDDQEIKAVVNGIENHAKLRIRRLRSRVDRPEAFSARWWFGTNNGRAFILMCLAGIFWITAFIIGIGQPLIHPNLFRGEDGLSKQEVLYNRVIADYQKDLAIDLTVAAPAKPIGFWQKTWKKITSFFNPKEKEKDQMAIQPTKSPRHWHHGVWIIATILTICFLIYGPWSLREEISEEVSLAVESMLDNDYAQSGDPWFERLVAWTGSYAVARNVTPKISVAAVDSDAEGNVSASPEQKENVWSELPVHLVSSALLKIVPAIFRAMFA